MSAEALCKIKAVCELVVQIAVFSNLTFLFPQSYDSSLSPCTALPSQVHHGILSEMSG